MAQVDEAKTEINRRKQLSIERDPAARNGSTGRFGMKGGQCDGRENRDGDSNGK